MPDQSMEQNIIESWTKCYLNETMNFNFTNDFQLKPIIKKCSIAHFRTANMEKVLEPYVGKLDEFLDYVGKEWKQNIEYDKTNGIIIADENKDYCVCPLVKNNIIQSEKLCSCSEGFTEKMFSYILQKKVKVEVVRSWIRDHKSCIYKITIK
ncbi:MAG TPA: hypothetical protein DDW65_16645 [Firmicutes bacterium]|jgi:hypothetical protein|nr:hypothetical protein [Bacillota bacterium]